MGIEIQQTFVASLPLQRFEDIKEEITDEDETCIICLSSIAPEASTD